MQKIKLKYKKLQKFSIASSLLVFIFWGLFFASQALADKCTVDKCPEGQRIQECCPNVPEEGLVPCGTVCCRCTLCDFFVLLKVLLDFLFFKLVPPIAFAMIVYGAILFIFSGGNPSKVSAGKAILKSVIIGLLLIYGAYSIVGTILVGVGLAEWTEQIYKDWWSKGIFKIECK